MIYILFKNDDEDYSSLPADEPKQFMFTWIRGAPNIAHLQTKLREVLDAVDPEKDFIVFTGPSYLVALAGYIWMTNEKRKHVNFYAYSLKDRRYVKHTEEVQC